MNIANDELLIAGHTADVLFNHSKLRTNIISWYDFKAGKSVLEIDPDSEVITSFLKQRGLEVSSVKSAALNTVGETFDYILSIGKINKDIVEFAREHIARDGAFFAAVNNSNGTMVRAGATSFIGDAGFGRGKYKFSAPSFIQKEELANLLEGAGFETVKWYYPLPEYRLASEIFSDKYLPKAGALASPTPSYDGDYVIKRSETADFDKVCDLGLFPEAANSYLVVCGGLDFAGCNMAYTKFNGLRAPEYRLATEIRIDEAGDRTVGKWAMEDSADAHLEKIKKNYDLLSEAYAGVELVPYKEFVHPDNGKLAEVGFDFVAGESLLSAEAIRRGVASGDVVSLINAKLDKIFDMKASNVEAFTETNAFRDMFSGVTVPSLVGTTAFKVSNVDSIISNFVVVGEKVVSLDYEWVFDFPMPVKYLKYRNLIYIFRENRAILEGNLTENDFMSLFGYSDAEIFDCEKLEMAFQFIVHGKDLRYNYLPHYQWRAWTKDEWNAGRKRRALRRIKRAVVKVIENI